MIQIHRAKETSYLKVEDETFQTLLRFLLRHTIFPASFVLLTLPYVLDYCLLNSFSMAFGRVQLDHREGQTVSSFASIK